MSRHDREREPTPVQGFPPLDIIGIESLADGAADVRVKFKTQPLNQGKVGNELRRRLMTTLVGRGIKPFAG